MSHVKNTTQANSQTNLDNMPEITSGLGQTKSLNSILKESKREIIERKKKQLAEELTIVSDTGSCTSDSKFEKNHSKLKDISPQLKCGENIERGDITEEDGNLPENYENVSKDVEIESTSLFDVDVSEQRDLPRLISPLSDSEVEDGNSSLNAWDEFIRKYQQLDIDNDEISSDSKYQKDETTSDSKYQKDETTPDSKYHKDETKYHKDETKYHKDETLYHKPQYSPIFSKRIEGERDQGKI